MTVPPDELPADLRERLALHLKTAASDVLAAAERDFKGIWRDADAYVRAQLAPLLQPHGRWILECCHAGALRRGYEEDRRCIWTIGLEDGRVLVFDTPRDSADRLAGA